MKEFAKGMSSKFLAVLLTLCILLGSVELPVMAADNQVSFQCTVCGQFTGFYSTASLTKVEEKTRYVYINGMNHYEYYTYRVTCDNEYCGATFEAEPRIQDGKIRPHEYVDGVCKCGYSEEVHTHNYVSEYYRSAYGDYNNESHTVIDYYRDHCTVSGCPQPYKDEYVGNTRQETHDIDDSGVCACGYRCQHGDENLKVVLQGYDTDDTYHTPIYRDKCKICGSYVGNEYIYENGREKHTFGSDGRCTVCDYKQEICTHPKSSWNYLRQVDTDYEKIDGTYHWAYPIWEVKCNNCGETFNDTDRTQTADKKRAHHFVNNVCDQCKYDRSSLLIVKGFTMTPNPVIIGETVTFTVDTDADRVQLILDGNPDRSFDKNDKITYTPDKIGDIKVSFRGSVGASDFGSACKEQTLTVTNKGKLNAPTVSAPSYILLGNSWVIRWSTVSNAESYVLVIKEYPSGDEMLRKIFGSNQTSYTVTPNDLNSEFIAQIYVTALAENYTNSDDGYAVTELFEKLPAPQITAPAANAQVDTHSVELTWNKYWYSNVDFLVTLAVNEDGLYKKVWEGNGIQRLNDGTDTSFTLSGLNYGKSYRVALAAVPDGADISDTNKFKWAEREFSVTQPQFKVSVSPANPQADEGETIELKLTVSPVESSNDAIIGLYDPDWNPLGGSMPVIQNGTAVLSRTVTQAKHGTYIYHYVVNGKGNMEGADGVQGEITVVFNDTTPTVRGAGAKGDVWAGSPATLEINTNKYTKWLQLFVKQGGSYNRYATLTAEENATGSYTYTCPIDASAFPKPGSYEFKVLPYNNANQLGNEYLFTVQAKERGKMPAPVITNLPNNTPVPDKNYEVKWNDVSVPAGATLGGYMVDFYKWDEETKWWKSIHQEVVKGKSFKLRDLTIEDKYRFEVYAINSEVPNYQPEDKQVAVREFTYLLPIPAFSMTVSCAGGIGDDVKVTWNPPVWADPSFKPDNFVIRLWGPDNKVDSKGGNETSYTFKGSECTLKEGNYSVEVYAMIKYNGEEYQQIASGNNEFSIKKGNISLKAEVVGDDVVLSGTADDSEYVLLNLKEKGSSVKDWTDKQVEVKDGSFSQLVPGSMFDKNQIYVATVQGWKTLKDKTKVAATGTKDLNVAKRDGTIGRVSIKKPGSSAATAGEKIGEFNKNGNKDTNVVVTTETTLKLYAIPEKGENLNGVTVKIDGGNSQRASKQGDGSYLRTVILTPGTHTIAVSNSDGKGITGTITVKDLNSEWFFNRYTSYGREFIGVCNRYPSSLAAKDSKYRISYRLEGHTDRLWTRQTLEKSNNYDTSVGVVDDLHATGNQVIIIEIVDLSTNDVVSSYRYMPDEYNIIIAPVEGAVIDWSKIEQLQLEFKTVEGAKSYEIVVEVENTSSKRNGKVEVFRKMLTAEWIRQYVWKVTDDSIQLKITNEGIQLSISKHTFKTLPEGILATTITITVDR